MNLTQKQVMILGGGLFLVLLVGYLVTTNLRSSTAPPAVNLKVWGTAERGDFEKLTQAYKRSRPNVTVEYTQVTGDFEERMVNALAAGTGPDVVMLGNRSIPRHKAKLAPAPPAQMSIGRLREFFPTVVEQNVTDAGQIYGLPLYLDTLGLIYNKNHFEQASLTAPPQTWEEFQSFIPFLRSVNENNQVVRAAAAMGGSGRTVNHASDIISLLMIQNGAAMTDEGRAQATFASGQAGAQAFNFYLQFGNSASPYYTWSEAQPNSLDAMARGSAAMVFGYYADLAAMRERSPFLEAASAPVPQVASRDARNIARYEVLAVTKRSARPDWAWDFVAVVTTNPEIVEQYLESSDRPAALKSLINKKINDENQGSFARAALTARDWYRVDDVRIDGYLNDAILKVLTGQADSVRALREAQDKTSQLMRNQ